MEPPSESQWEPMMEPPSESQWEPMMEPPSESQWEPIMELLSEFDYCHNRRHTRHHWNPQIHPMVNLS